MIRKQHSLLDRTFESIKGNVIAQVKGLLDCSCPVCNENTICIMSDEQELNIYCSSCWSDLSKSYTKPKTTFNISFNEYPGVDIILFGKHRNKQIYRIVKEDPSYVKWLCTKDVGLDDRYKHLLFNIAIDYAAPNSDDTVHTYTWHKGEELTQIDSINVNRGCNILSDFDGNDWDDMASLGYDYHEDWFPPSSEY